MCDRECERLLAMCPSRVSWTISTWAFRVVVRHTRNRIVRWLCRAQAAKRAAGASQRNLELNHIASIYPSILGGIRIKADLLNALSQ